MKKVLTFGSYIKELLLHIAVFTVLCFLYIVMLFNPRSVPTVVFYEYLEALPTLLYGLSYCILFYFSFFKKILLRAKFTSVMFSFALLILGFCFCDAIFTNILLVKRYSVHYAVHNIKIFDFGTAFRLIIFSAYAVVYSLIKGFAWLKLQKQQVEKENVIASLQNLRSQIEPHFIFNSLNGVYALSIEEQAQKTSQSLEELSGLFRYSLMDRNVTKVPIEEELGFIEKYIHLHKIRVPESVQDKINTSMSWDKKPAFIAPMITVTFIENAFKYGFSFKEDFFIEILISVEEGRFNLEVKNSIHETKNNGKNGIGLKNVHTRLELLYPRRHFLEETKTHSKYEVVLSINLV